MDPSYSNSFSAGQNGAVFPQDSGAIVLQSRGGSSKKKWWIIVITGVVIVLALIGVFMMPKNKQQQKSTKDVLLTYSNYLLYGEEKNSPIEEKSLWPVVFYKEKLKNRDESYFNRIKELFGVFADGFKKESRENKSEDELQYFELIDNLITTNEGLINSAILYIETGELGSGDDSDRELTNEEKQTLLYKINVGVVDTSEWIYREYMEGAHEGQ